DELGLRTDALEELARSECTRTNFPIVGDARAHGRKLDERAKPLPEPGLGALGVVVEAGENGVRIHSCQRYHEGGRRAKLQAHAEQHVVRREQIAVRLVWAIVFVLVTSGCSTPRAIPEVPTGEAMPAVRGGEDRLGIAAPAFAVDGWLGEDPGNIVDLR